MSEQTATPAPAERLSERVWRLRAPNPGPMTLTGTNTYLVQDGPDKVLVIDPGPEIENHLQAIVQTAAGLKAAIGLILVTHGHPDHYPGAARLHDLTGAPVAAHSSAVFPHQLDLEDALIVPAHQVRLLSIYTPGHAPDHLCYYLEEEQALFSGDNILGSGTTVVAPPKGNMAHYLASLRLLEQNWGHARVIYGGHGPEIREAGARLREYITHRAARQQQLISALEAGPSTIPQVVERIYQDVDRRLWPAAARQVLAYLIMLEEEGRVSAEEVIASEAELALLNPPGQIDAVAAAELGISGQTGQEPEKFKRYRLV